MPTILVTFDLPQMNPNCTQRMDSTVVSQPLHLLNNKMIYELSRALAERVEREIFHEPQQQARVDQEAERAHSAEAGEPGCFGADMLRGNAQRFTATDLRSR